MTIAIAVKVAEGVVLASDSMATHTTPNVDPVTGEPKVINLYDKAAKIFQFHKDICAGLVVWGSSIIAGYPLGHLLRDFEVCRIEDRHHKEGINPVHYSIQEVAEKWQAFVQKRNCECVPVQDAKKLDVGFLIGGYSQSESFGEVWEVRIKKGEYQKPSSIIKAGETKVIHRGMDDALTRLLEGYEEKKLKDILEKCDVCPGQISDIIESCRVGLGVPEIFDGMPIMNAADLAVFLVEAAARYTQFYREGPNSVGGPVQVAIVTRYSGLRKILTVESKM